MFSYRAEGNAMKVFNQITIIFFLVLLVLMAPAAIARAATIEFVASDLVDTTPGEDLWRYDYTVSGRNFLQSEFFDIYFSANLYGMLTAAAGPNADWDVAILQQPNPANLPPFDRGMFDAFALTDNPSLSGTFSVNFVFLGSGSPGSQKFEIFDAASTLAESGFTRAPGQVIPEPSTAAPFFIALVAGAIQLRRRSEIRR